MRPTQSRRYVYLVHGTFKGYSFVKVGHSSNPWARRTQISAHCPFLCELVEVVEHKQAAPIEREIHGELASCKIAGEWYECSIADASKAIREVFQRHGLEVI